MFSWLNRRLIIEADDEIEVNEVIGDAVEAKSKRTSGIKKFWWLIPVLGLVLVVGGISLPV